MKKNYNQPIVETTRLEIYGQALCASPTGLPISGGGGGTPEPIPSGGGGDYPSRR